MSQWGLASDGQRCSAPNPLIGSTTPIASYYPRVTARRYVHVPYPWKADIEVGSLWPSSFYARLISQASRYALPAARRGGMVRALVGRKGIPVKLLGTALERLPAKPSNDVDPLLRGLRERWHELGTRARGLPLTAPPLSTLTLHRSAGLTVFVFGDSADPLVVAKSPLGDRRLITREIEALNEAAPARVAPLYLGEVGEASVQEGVKGAPLALKPVTPRTASSLSWHEPFGEVAAALIRLAEVTSKAATPDEDDVLGSLDGVTDVPELDGQCRRALVAARRDLQGLKRSVLRHGDTSAQNCLLHHDRLSGLVDWELARTKGAPGFDMLNAAVAYLEHGVGLKRWSQRLVIDSFEAAWDGSDFFGTARKAARTSMGAAGVPDRYHDPLELAFFARRMHRRLERPGAYPTNAATAARMLLLACTE